MPLICKKTKKQQHPATSVKCSKAKYMEEGMPVMELSVSCLSSARGRVL